MKNVQDFYPLSPMQQGMLFHSLYAPESGVYLEQLSCTLHGCLNIRAFEQAWQKVMDRHAVLRTAFVGEGLKELVQVVHKLVKAPLEQHDWRDIPEAAQAARLETFLAQEQQRGFKLAEPPLMRLSLIRLSEETFQFTWSYHHALLDGWSVPRVLQQVLVCYTVLVQGYKFDLPPARPYRDYIVWLKRQDMAEAEVFWRQALQGFTAPTPLVVDCVPQQSQDSAAVGEDECWLSAEATAALQSLGRREQVTISTLVQAAWALLLSRYSGEEDVVFGVTVSGRPPDLPGSEDMVGLFINTLPVRVFTPAGSSLIPWLKDLQARQVELRQYEYSPLVQVQGWSDAPRGMPLFDSILVFENYPIEQALQEHAGDLRIGNIRSHEQTNLPITVVAGLAGALMLRIVYDSRRFDRETIGRMLGHLRTLLEGMAAGPAQRLADLSLLTEAERRQMLVEWDNTAAEFPRDALVHHLFEEQAARSPDAVAVTLGGEHLTYVQLDRRANQLGHYLRKLGIGPEMLVGICVRRSLEMIEAILGVLKSGGAYVPLDPLYPPDRLAFMLEDSGVLVLLTQRRLVESLPAHCARVVCLDADWNVSPGGIAQESEQNVNSGATAENLAYVIYTSGSTGRPKGTLLQHRGLCNLVQAFIGAFVEPGGRVLQFFSYSFDGSVADFFSSLVGGATLCMAEDGAPLSGPELVGFLRDQSVTTAPMPPSLLSILPANELPNLQTVISAGDQCTPEVVTRWASGRRFFNAYGPTEATVAVAWYRVDGRITGEVNIPIGRPIANTQIYLLDQRLRPSPIGAPGELYVGGAGLARGYLNRPELTAEKFIPSPFGSSPRLYKTGDLARFRPDGNIEFLGRIDHQAKVRGFRVELGEVEAVLRQHPAVKEAVAVAREGNSGERSLAAYLTSRQQPAPGADELRSFLREKLPQYMLPSVFVVLDAFPLTPNGKIDRRALPAPDKTRRESERGYVAPRDDLELELARIWEEILDVRPVGVRDNFFDLGGHSLLAVRLVAQIQQRLGQNLSLVTLFQEPTIERLARIIKGRQLDEKAEKSLLVELRHGDSKRPLFFVHPSGGSVHWYLELAERLPPDQPFYGIQARGADGDQEIDTEIVQMARRYVKAVQSVQPEGPYLLGSWSMGVMIAFEMAQQLEAMGERVALLALLDQGPALPFREPKDDAEYLVETFGKNVPLSLERLRQLAPGEQVAHVFEEARKVNWIYPDVTLDQFSRFVRMLRTHTESWRRYAPRVYPGCVTLFRASEQPAGGCQDWDLGWGKLAAGGVEIHQAPGDHLSVIHEPHVQALAEQLRVCIDAAT